jgi:hypothetical protein
MGMMNAENYLGFAPDVDHYWDRLRDYLIELDDENFDLLEDEIAFTIPRMELVV